MAVLVNRAKMSTSTTGTGTITLGSAEDNYQTFADAGVANADYVRYVIEDGNNWEIGKGVYTSSGTTLTRVVEESNNSNNAINLSGSAIVFIGTASSDILVRPTVTNFTPSAVTTLTTVNDAIAWNNNSSAIYSGGASVPYPTSGNVGFAAVDTTIPTTIGNSTINLTINQTVSNFTLTPSTAPYYAAYIQVWLERTDGSMYRIFQYGTVNSSSSGAANTLGAEHIIENPSNGGVSFSNPARLVIEYINYVNTSNNWYTYCSYQVSNVSVTGKVFSEIDSIFIDLGIV